MGIKRMKRIRKVNRRKHRINKNITPEMRAKLATIPTLPNGKPNPLYKPNNTYTQITPGNDAPVMLRLQQAQLKNTELSTGIQNTKNILADIENDIKINEDKLRTKEKERAKREKEKKILEDKLNAETERRKQELQQTRLEKKYELKSAIAKKDQAKRDYENKIHTYEMTALEDSIEKANKETFDYITKFSNLPTQGTTQDTVSGLNYLMRTIEDISKVLNQGIEQFDETTSAAIAEKSRNIAKNISKSLYAAKHYNEERQAEAERLKRQTDDWAYYSRQLTQTKERLKYLDEMDSALNEIGKTQNYMGEAAERYYNAFNGLKEVEKDMKDYVVKYIDDLNEQYEHENEQEEY